MRVAGLFTAFLLAAAAPAGAYTVKSPVACPDIVREDGNETYREMNKWWLMGYLTGRNFAGDSAVGRQVDNDRIYQMAVGYCRANPDRTWDNAALYVHDLLQ